MPVHPKENTDRITDENTGLGLSLAEPVKDALPRGNETVRGQEDDFKAVRYRRRASHQNLAGEPVVRARHGTVAADPKRPGIHGLAVELPWNRMGIRKTTIVIKGANGPLRAFKPDIHWDSFLLSKTLPNRVTPIVTEDD